MSEQELSERFNKPKGWLWGQFENARGALLRFGTLNTHKTPLAHIVYVEGLSEYAEKTYELAQDFNKIACNFSVLDRHGQGKSPRYLSDPHKQHSEGVMQDVDDLIAYCRKHIPPGRPIVLLGHSTGGLIALMALEKEPDLFKAAMITGPLLGIKNPLVRGWEELIAHLPLPRFIKELYIPGGHPWIGRDDPASPLKSDDFSADPERNKIHDYWNRQDPALRTGSPTLGWIIEMCKAMKEVRNPDFLARIKQPVLVFTGGEDALVDNRPTFAAMMNLGDTEHYHYADGHHEVLTEKDSIRNDILTRAQAFLKKIL